MSPQELFKRWKAGDSRPLQSQILSRVPGSIGRAARVDEVYWNLWETLYADGYMPDGMYVEGSGYYMIASKEGKLYRIYLSESEGTVSVGEVQQVKQEFVPVADGSEERLRTNGQFFVTRQADGRTRWISISASAVLNRVNEIDSRALFDSFIEYINDTGEQPYLTFYHLGERLRMGVADFSHREGYLYIQSGLFDTEGVAGKLAEMAIGALERDDDGTWGISIGFQATAAPEILRVSEVEIPVYTQGRQVELSMLLERDAASNQTRLMTRGLSDMAKLEELLANLTGDTAQAKLLADEIAATNRTIEAEGMITRSTDDAPAPAAVPEDEQVGDPLAAAELETEEDAELVIDEVLVDEIANRVADLLSQRIDAVRQEAEKRAKSDADASTKVAERLALIEKRLNVVEADDSARLEELTADMPRRKKTITFRPSHERATSEDAEGEGLDLSKIADARVAQLENYFGASN